MPTGETLVPLAVIVGAHGVRGELRVKPYNPSSELLLSLPRVLLRPSGSSVASEVRLRDVRWHGDGLLAALEGCSDRDAALALRGAELCVPRARLPQPAEGEYYLIDLIGLTARTSDGRVVGKVSEALEYPASQALRVEVEGGAIEVPLIAPYVVEIRLDERLVIVDHVEELDLVPTPRRGR